MIARIFVSLFLIGFIKLLSFKLLSLENHLNFSWQNKNTEINSFVLFTLTEKIHKQYFFVLSGMTDFIIFNNNFYNLSHLNNYSNILKLTKIILKVVSRFFYHEHIFIMIYYICHQTPQLRSKQIWKTTNILLYINNFCICFWII